MLFISKKQIRPLCIFMISDKHDGLRMNNNLKQEKSGVHGIWGIWLDFLFFENIIYIFCAIHFLMFFFCLFVYCFLFKTNVFFLHGVLHREKQMKDILREAVVETHDHVLSFYHYWRCMWLCLSVCEWVFVRIHQGVTWNYFLASKEHFDCLFFLWYWTKKKQKKKGRPVPLWFICSSPLTLSHFIFSS